MARNRGKGRSSKEVRANQVEDGEFEVAPFTFDSIPTESSGRNVGLNASKGIPDMPLGQFSDAEMEFEPFMFDQGDKAQMPNRSANAEAAPSGFSFEPFSASNVGTAVEDMHAVVEDSPIVGGDLPLPAYFSPGTSEGTSPKLEQPAAWSTERQSTPLRHDTTGGLVMPTGPMPTGPMQAAPVTETGGLRGEQMTGRTPTGSLDAAPVQVDRTPTGPLGAVPAPTTPVTGLGRTRGNTGPLGPLPPDRSVTPNASWSDSSLASIEDFSSILIAMQAGKKLRQSTPLNESMIPQAAPVMEAPVIEAPVQNVRQSTDQLRAQMVAAEVETAQPEMPFTMTVPEARTSESDRVSAFVNPANDNDVPEWAMRATDAATATQGLPELDDTYGMPADDMSTIEVEAAELDMVQQAAPSVEATEDTSSSDFSWVTGQWEPELPATTAVPVGEMESSDTQAASATQTLAEEPVMATEAVEVEAQPAMSATAEAAQAELEASKKAEANAMPSNLEPEVVETLRRVDPAVAAGNISGEDIEFEGFMFNQGNATPMSALPAPSADELADLADMGPVFDPSLYANVEVEEDEDEDDSIYEGLDGSAFAEIGGPMGGAGAGRQNDENKTGDLPFWLQGESNEAPTGMLIQDIARRGWGTKEFLMEPQAQPSIPSEWVGSAQTVEPAPAELFGAQPEMITPDAQNDYGQLPEIEPFDFSLLPTNETVESLGFNTEELTGLAAIEHDPMTVTVNLAAVADLLGGPADTWDESDQMNLQPAQRQEAAPAQVMEPVQEQPQHEWTQDDQVEMSTVISLEMNDAAPPTMEPAVEVADPVMSAVETVDYSETDYAGEVEAEMPTLALDTTVEPAYEEAVPQAGVVESYVEEAEEPVVAESQPALHSMPATPAVESHRTSSWMANATTDLSESALNDLAGESGSMLSQPTEVDLTMDGEDVSPFDYDQLELEAEDDQHTGHLEADQLSRTYGTGKLAMPDEQDVLMRSRPLNDVWSEADGDASLFVTGPRTENEPGEATEEAEPAVEVAAQPAMTRENEPLDYMDEESAPTGYLAEESEPELEVSSAAADTYEPAVYETPSVEIEEYVQSAPPSQDVKVRVASGSWSAYNQTQNKAEPVGTAQSAMSAPVVELVAPVAPVVSQQPAMQAEVVQRPEPVPVAQPQQMSRNPRFDDTPKMPARNDILITGPLPSLEGFEDVSEWAGTNPQDVGTQLALAAGYAQAEDFDAALRVYRKIIRRPSTSDTILQMIGDDLGDIEDVAGHLPRYYQVVGDILMRLGRHREAVEAYNKIK